MVEINLVLNIGDRVKGLRPSVLKIQGSVINKDDT